MTPNICALYVEEEVRGKGLAGELLESVYRHLAKYQISDAYSLATTADFVERNGWDFFSLVKKFNGKAGEMYHKKNN